MLLLVAYNLTVHCSAAVRVLMHVDEFSIEDIAAVPETAQLNPNASFCTSVQSGILEMIIL
jgi:hypothetical protein